MRRDPAQALWNPAVETLPRDAGKTRLVEVVQP
jgi:hypothetical protein